MCDSAAMLHFLVDSNLTLNLSYPQYQKIDNLSLIDNKKMQHSCGVTYSIALAYQFQNTTILVNLFQLH